MISKDKVIESLRRDLDKDESRLKSYTLLGGLETPEAIMSCAHDLITTRARVDVAKAAIAYIEKEENVDEACISYARWALLESSRYSKRSDHIGQIHDDQTRREQARIGSNLLAYLES